MNVFITFNKTKIFDWLYAIFGITFLFFMITTSNGFTELKTILLAITSLIAFIEIIVNEKECPKFMLAYLIVFVTYYSLSLVYGIFSGYRFSLGIDNSLINIYLFTPILVCLLSNIFYGNEYRKQFLFTCLTYITVFLVVLDLWKMGNYMNLMPDFFILDLVKVYSSEISDDKLAFRVVNEASFMFLLPIYSFLVFHYQNNVERFIYGFIVIGGGLYCLLSGRKMLEIVFFGFLVINYFYYMKKLSINKLKNTVIIMFLILLFVTLVINISSRLNINSVFETSYKTITVGLSSRSDGVNKRLDNFVALVLLFTKSPIWGNGLNSFAQESIASSKTLWSYEIIYVALLAQTGVIGVSIFGVAVFYIVRNLYINYKVNGDSRYLAIMEGFIAFIICGSSNPLVYYVWPWVVSLSFACNISNRRRLRSEKPEK